MSRTDPEAQVDVADDIASSHGLAREAEDPSEELVGVFAVLAKQHAEASALLTRAKAGIDECRQLWPTIRMELLSHEQGEMREVYPVLRQYAETLAMADEHDLDASELQDAIARMDALRADDDTWQSTLEALIALIEAHVEDEETDIFPSAQQVIGEARARALETPFLNAKKQVAEAV